jgi:membrane associated rhomboid family serine protease
MDNIPTCYRHPTTEAYLQCSRCGRYICGVCANPGSVGQHCPACLKEQGTQQVIRPTGRGLASRFSKAPVVRAVLFITVVISATERFGLIDWTLLAMWPQSTGLTEPWQFVTHALIHGGFIHLAFNMYALFILGIGLERGMGSRSFASLYVFATLASGVAVFFLSSGPTVGASGAVYGLFGYYLGNAIDAKQQGLGTRQLRAFAPILLINLVISLSPGISWQGHLGGLAAGIAFYFMQKSVKKR